MVPLPSEPPTEKVSANALSEQAEITMKTVRNTAMNLLQILSFSDSFHIFIIFI
jgi:hypothetical protein